jgi:hypothetical protein
MLDFSEEWLHHFVHAIVPTQINVEEAVFKAAKKKNIRVIAVDRGLLDPAAFIRGGLAQFSARHQIDPVAAFGRYDLVFVLQSVAEFNPSLYGTMRNRVRFHSAEQALTIAEQLRQIWAPHPKVVYVSGNQGVESVIRTIEKKIREQLV